MHTGLCGEYMDGQVNMYMYVHTYIYVLLFEGIFGTCGDLWGNVRIYLA